LKLGEGFAKIQLCSVLGVEVHAYTLTGLIQSGLVQVVHPEDLDTEGIELMDNGDRKKIVSGKNIEIIIPVRTVESKTPAGWETFLYQLWDWEYKIKVTPHVDEVAYTYWVLLRKGRMSERQLRNLVEIDVLEFVGAERLSSVS